MTSRTPLARWTVIAAAIALTATGCTSAPDSSATPSAPASSAPATSDDGSGDGASDGASEQAGAYVEYRDGIIAETAGTKVLFFHAPWCPQCRALEESILEGDIPDDLTIIKADFDSETELRQQYGVTIQTTIVYVDDDGALLASEVLYSDTTLDALVAAAP